MTARLAVVGAPGSGKSAVAAELAARWRCPFIDTDEEYLKVHGVAVGEAVIDDEPAFRQQEEALVLKALRTQGAIVAVGSGALSEPVLEALRLVPVVWLEVGLVDAVRRSGLSGMRPVALGNIRAQIGDMLAERAPLYASVADLTVSTDARMVTSVAEEIEDWERTR